MTLTGLPAINGSKIFPNTMIDLLKNGSSRSLAINLAQSRPLALPAALKD
jgi:hypothetical protein